MSVTLFLPAVLARLADGTRIESTGGTIAEVVGDVAARYPALAERLRDADGKPYPFVTFYLNDEDIRFHGGFDATVQHGNEVTVLPTITRK
jgi:molybdopterin converting factor small subunit